MSEQVSNTDRKKKTRRVCFRIDEETVQFLDFLAEYMNLSRSELIRMIIYNMKLNFIQNKPLSLMFMQKIQEK